MVVQVVEWKWIFEMDVVVVEVDGMDSMELGVEDIKEKNEDIMDFSHNVFSNLVAKIGFRVEMANVSKERICSNYFEMVLHNLENVN